MMAIEYTDMIRRMITTVIATAPMFLTISVIVNSLPVVDPAAGLGLCKRNRRKPIAFVPRMVVKIVTVTPPKVLITLITYRQYRPSAGRSRLFWRTSAPAYLLRNKVIDDYAIYLHGLAGKFGGRKFRRARGRHGSGLQQRMS